MEEKSSIYRKCVACELKVDRCKQLTERIQKLQETQRILSTITTGNTKNSEHYNYRKHKEF